MNPTSKFITGKRHVISKGCVYRHTVRDTYWFVMMFSGKPNLDANDTTYWGVWYWDGARMDMVMNCQSQPEFVYTYEVVTVVPLALASALSNLGFNYDCL